MATAAQQSKPPAPPAAPQQGRPATPLVDQMLERFKEVSRDLAGAAQQLTDLLPDALKGQATRFLKRAEMTFRRNPDLAACPTREFVRCVLAAAEVGLAIDGKLAYVVRYKSTWQFQADYKGLVAVGKLWKVIRDCYADVVTEGDQFQAYREGPNSYLKHERNLAAKRGEVTAAYAVVVQPDGFWRYELMDRDELDQIQRLAPAKNGPWGSPFATVVNQMRIKTVIRRAMKLYQNDPAVAACLASMDDEDELADLGQAAQPLTPPAPGRYSLRNGAHPPEPTPEEYQAEERASELENELSIRLEEAQTQYELEEVRKAASAVMAELGEARYAAFCQRQRELWDKMAEPREPGADG